MREDYRGRGVGKRLYHALLSELSALGYCQAFADMRSRAGDQLAGLRALLGAQADGTLPELPNRLIEGPDASLELGGTVFEFRHRGGGHTPGDMVVWLPQSRVLFAGDTVYVDRLLAIIPVSSTRNWLETFTALEQLAPRHIVPGHGRVTDLTTARTQTRAYLEALRAHMKRAVDQGVDLAEAVKTFDARPWLHLLNAADLMPGNANRTYLELERE